MTWETVNIETERLLLKPIFEADILEVIQYYSRNQEHLRLTVPAYPDEFLTTPYWEERVSVLRIAFDQDDQVPFVCVKQDTGDRIVGLCNFSAISRGPSQACYLGFSVDGDEQGNGYMTEAVQAGIQYMFGTRNLHRIMANHLPDNSGSARVLEKLGFVREGHAKQYLYLDGKWRDHVMTSLTNSAWDDRCTE